MVFWYIPYKPNGCDFIKTVRFGYGLIYSRLTETCKYVYIYSDAWISICYMSWTIIIICKSLESLEL